jgi:hypothetical protein
MSIFNNNVTVKICIVLPAVITLSISTSDMLPLYSKTMAMYLTGGKDQLIAIPEDSHPDKSSRGAGGPDRENLGKTLFSCCYH